MQRLGGDTILDLTIDGEHVKACELVKEKTSMKKSIEELSIIPIIEYSTTLFCDNNVAIIHVKEPRAH